MDKPVVKLDGLGSDFESVTAKISTVLRHADTSELSVMAHNLKPKVGDILLAKVMSVGDKDTLQSPDGRNVELHKGDKVLVAYGNRYAVEEYEAMVPEDLGDCHLVSGGGVASRIERQNKAMGEPTVLRPIGMFKGKNGNALNTADFSLGNNGFNLRERPPVILVIGTGMDAGKTTTASALIKGMSRAGYKPGFGKITGTGLSSDIHKPFDAGAIAGCDFVDMGYPSTYRLPTQDIERIMSGVITNLSLNGSDFIVMEVADGVLQEDNRKLLTSENFRKNIDGVVLAADSGLSALYATQKLDEYGYRVMAVSGRMTMAPLTADEYNAEVPKAIRPILGVKDKEQLEMKKTALSIVDEVLKSGGKTSNKKVRKLMEERGIKPNQDFEPELP